MPSPILPRSGLLDTPAVSAADLSSAPTRSFRDVVLGGPSKSATRSLRDVVVGGPSESSARASVQGRDAPASLSQVVTSVDIPAPGPHDTPSWAFQPPPEFVNSPAASRVEGGPLPASLLLSTSSTLPLEASSESSPNVPASALDSQALAAEFLNSVVQNAPSATSSPAAVGTARLASSYLPSSGGIARPASATVTASAQPPGSSSFLSSGGMVRPASAPVAASAQQPGSFSFPSAGGMAGEHPRAPDLLQSTGIPPALPDIHTAPATATTRPALPPERAVTAETEKQLRERSRAQGGGAGVTSFPGGSSTREDPETTMLPFPSLSSLPSAVVVGNTSSLGPLPSRPPVPSFLSPVGRSSPGHGPSLPSAAEELPRASTAPVNSPPPQALQSRNAAAHQRRRLVLTPSAASMMLSLHNGEVDLLQPLEGDVASAFVENLQQAALDLFGLPLAQSTATTAMEVSRHLPGANGWPTSEEALACLRFSAPSAVLPQLAAPTTDLPPPTLGSSPGILPVITK
jgi:hypothetical protein